MSELPNQPAWHTQAQTTLAHWHPLPAMGTQGNVSDRETE